MLSRNQSTAICLRLFAMIQTCTSLFKYVLSTMGVSKESISKFFENNITFAWSTNFLKTIFTFASENNIYFRFGKQYYFRFWKQYYFRFWKQYYFRFWKQYYFRFWKQYYFRFWKQYYFRLVRKNHPICQTYFFIWKLFSLRADNESLKSIFFTFKSFFLVLIKRFFKNKTNVL